MFRRVQCHTENVSLSQESVFKNINFYNRECVAASERGHHHRPGEQPAANHVRSKENYRSIEQVLQRQVREGLKGVNSSRFHELVIAYEPLWAIGTGRTATPEQAQETQAFIRSVIASISDQTVAAKVRIQYGVSVKPDNAKALLQKPDIDGALVGGASLDPRGFVQIIRSAVAVAEQQDFR